VTSYVGIIQDYTAGAIPGYGPDIGLSSMPSSSSCTLSRLM